MITDTAGQNHEATFSSNEDGARSLKQRAYVELKNRILRGGLPPGMLLSERQLARSLKMSRTPVHAALERLEGDGLVMVAAQQGIVVRSISPQEIADHFELREAIESFVVLRLAGRLTPEQADTLKRNLQEHRQAVRQGDIAEHIRIDAEFHLLLCEFRGNAEITRAMGQIRDKIHRVMSHISTRSPGRMLGALHEHETIAEALLDGDGAAAAQRMATHLRSGLQSIYQRDT